MKISLKSYFTYIKFNSFNLTAGTYFAKLKSIKWQVVVILDVSISQKVSSKPRDHEADGSDLKVRPDSEPSDNKSECALTAESSSRSP